jgi:antitoxin ParD1/3/4
MPQLQPQPRRNTSIALNSHFLGFIDTQVQSGRYETASDVMRAGLRLLEEREAKVRALEAALIEGEQSGNPAPFDYDAFEAFKAGKRAELER